MYTFLELLYILELYVHCKQENYSNLGRIIRCLYSPRSVFTYFPNYLSCPITKNSKFFLVIANNSLNEHIENKTYINCISILTIKWKWSRTFLRKLSLFIIKPTIIHCFFANSGAFWIGGTDGFVEGHWVWISTMQAMTVTDWGESLNHTNDSSNDCLQIQAVNNDHTPYWQPAHCSDKTNFICEIP